MKVKVSQSCPTLSLGFSRQEYWSGLPFSSLADFPDPGIEPGPPALGAEGLSHWTSREVPTFSCRHPLLRCPCANISSEGRWQKDGRGCPDPSPALLPAAVLRPWLLFCQMRLVDPRELAALTAHDSGTTARMTPSHRTVVAHVEVINPNLLF